MRSKLSIGIVVFACLSAWACGSATNSNTNSNVVVTNLNTANGSNVEVVTPGPLNGIRSNSNRRNAQAPQPSDNVKPKPVEAPNDSEYTVVMDKSGVPIETRTFHTDPFITKVERIWKGVNDKTISIYLKNGKVVPVPGDKWPDIKSQPVQVFYQAADVKPPSPPAGTSTNRRDEKPKH